MAISAYIQTLENVKFSVKGVSHHTALRKQDNLVCERIKAR